VKENAMKLSIVSCASFAFVLALAATASAAVVETISLNYTGVTRDINGNSYTIPFTKNGTIVSTPWNSSYIGTVSEFNVVVGITGLTSDQDLDELMLLKVATGGIANDDRGLFGGSYVGNNPVIDPPAMGDSNAPSATAYFDNFDNAYALAVIAQTGGSQTGNGNGTYGDYSAYWQLGETGGQAYAQTANVIGQLYLTLNGPGSFTFGFKQNPGYLDIISNNTSGMGIAADESMPDYSGICDTVTIVPEPGTFALLACGLIGLLAFASRKRK
jgi:hypothetical protein